MDSSDELENSDDNLADDDDNVSGDDDSESGDDDDAATKEKSNDLPPSSESEGEDINDVLGDIKSSYQERKQRVS